MMGTNLQRMDLFIAFRVLNLGRNYKNSFRVYACCFVNNTVTYVKLFVCPFKRRDMFVMTRVPNFIL